MSADLQKRFKELARIEDAYDGRAPSQADLSALFVVRSSQLYLRSGGIVAFVLPMAVLSRTQFEPLRNGRFKSVKIAWSAAWMMDRDLHPLFPVPSAVLIGRKQARSARAPATVTKISGALPIRDADEQLADRGLAFEFDYPAPKAARSEGGSPYRSAFRCGANPFPRVLVLAERQAAGRLGTDVSAPLVQTVPSMHKPWSELEPVRERVEESFLRTVYLGESILPYRVFRTFEGVVPASEQGRIFDSHSALEAGHEHLARWLSQVEVLWNEHGSGARPFRDQINYIGQLAGQFPLPQLRVVYTKSGTLPAAALLRDGRAVVDQKLFWSEPKCEEEGYYLISVLNSEAARSRAEEYQSKGLFGTRDFDKVMFNLPIPLFKASEALHRELADAGAQAEAVAANVELKEGEKFQRARKRVRDALAEDGIGGDIEKLVEKLLGSA